MTDLANGYQRREVRLVEEIDFAKFVQVGDFGAECFVTDSDGANNHATSWMTHSLDHLLVLVNT
jgi:hypothetical protein